MEEAAGRTTFGMPTTSPWCYTLQGHGPCRDLFVGIDEGAQVTEITRARRATGGHARQCDAPPRGSGTATKFRFLESCTEGVGEVGRTGLGTGATKGRPLFNVAPGAAGGGVRFTVTPGGVYAGSGRARRHHRLRRHLPDLPAQLGVQVGAHLVDALHPPAQGRHLGLQGRGGEGRRAGAAPQVTAGRRARVRSPARPCCATLLATCVGGGEPGRAGREAHGGARKVRASQARLRQPPVHGPQTRRCGSAQAGHRRQHSEGGHTSLRAHSSKSTSRRDEAGT